jgi:hypothetical protein
MLQIIGWLGCLYLVVKALEIASADSHKGKDGGMTPAAVLAVLVAWAGAIGFGGWLFIQGNALKPDGQTVRLECIRKAQSAQEVTACYE